MEHAANSTGDLNARLDAKDSKNGVQEFPISANPAAGEGTWCFHPDNSIDIAVLPVNMQSLNEHGFEPGWFASDQTAADTSKLKELEVAAGDGAFVLGFPMNLTGEQHNYVIVRQGAIARISEMLDGASKVFMLDALVFPGNSGGPVVLKPDAISIQGTKNQSVAYLIGLVLSYLPYTDMAISVQTKHPRITFEENSGLAEVLPVDYVDQTIAACRWAQQRQETKGANDSKSPPKK